MLLTHMRVFICTLERIQEYMDEGGRAGLLGPSQVTHVTRIHVAASTQYHVHNTFTRAGYVAGEVIAEFLSCVVTFLAASSAQCHHVDHH